MTKIQQSDLHILPISESAVFRNGCINMNNFSTIQIHSQPQYEETIQVLHQLILSPASQHTKSNRGSTCLAWLVAGKSMINVNSAPLV